MSEFTFLHAADLHLDTPFVGLSRGSEAVGEALRDASLVAFDRLVQLALDEEVAFVLFAGDVYDGAVRGLRAQLRFRRGLERLSAAGIPSFVVHGNHDPLEEGWAAIRRWPEGVHVFGWQAPKKVPVVRDGVHLATIHGQSYARRAEERNLARGFQPTPGEPALQVGLLHANVGGQPGHDDYAPCTLTDLREGGLDYWALGHVHTRQVLLQGGPWAVYPGNLQGRSLKPSELGSKGASLVRVRGGAVVEVEHRHLAPIVFHRLRVDVGGADELPEVERRLLDGVEALGDGGDGWLVAAELVGETALHAELLREGEALRQALDDLTMLFKGRWVHWVELEVATTPLVDRDALRAQQDLLGAILRHVDALRGDDDALRSLLREVDRGLGALGRDAEVDDPGGLLAEVERLAIGELHDPRAAGEGEGA